MGVTVAVEEEAMGVANKAWKYSGGVLVKNFTFLYNNSDHDKEKQKPVEQHWLSWKWWGSWPSLAGSSAAGRKTRFSWSVKVCGVLLFVVGLISLFTGHLASDLEWYSQRLVKRTLYYKVVIISLSHFLFGKVPFFKL